MNIRRIAVGINASSHSVAALQTAALLAARQRAELMGLLVEDIDLLHLAALPFAREMIYPVALGQAVDAHSMERRLQALAENARDTVSREAIKARVHWSFRVRRGQVLQELRAAAAEADLLVIGRASHLEKRKRVRLGTTAAQLLAGSPRPILTVSYGETCSGPSLIVWDGSPDSARKIQPALEWAQLFGGHTPTLLLWASSREELDELKQPFEATIGGKDIHFRRCAPTEVRGIGRIAHEEQAGLVILAGIPLERPPEELPDWLGKIDCPVLLATE